jgi:hypothetical protein
MRVGEETDVRDGSHMKRCKILIFNLYISMSNWLIGSNQSGGTISGLLNDPSILLDDTVSKVLAFNTESLGVSCINVLGDGHREVW